MERGPEHFGFLTRNFLPEPEGNLGLVPKLVRGTRNLLTNWAKDIPVLGWGTEIARAVI